MAQTSITKDQKTLKQWANILGYSGTIPFISLAVILLLDASSTTPAASGPSRIGTAFIWRDYIKFSGRIALGTDSMQSRYQTL
jgi:hypothetical protein